jgi:type II secretory pathway component PulF
MKIQIVYKYKIIVENKIIVGEIFGKSYSDIKNYLPKCKIIYIRKSIKIIKKVPILELKMFCQVIQRYIRAGLPISTALLELEKHNFKSMQHIISKINRDIQNGNNLSTSMEKHRNAFDDIFINNIKTGERIGNLDNSLSEIINYLGKINIVDTKIKSARRYPAIICIVLLILIIFMKNFFIQNLVEFMDTLKVEQPRATKFLIKFLFNEKAWAILSGTLIIFHIIIKHFLGNNLRKRLHKLLFYFPYFGNLLFKKNLFYFTYNMHILLKNNVMINEAIKISKRGIKNLFLLEKFDLIERKIINGDHLSSSMESEKIFPNVMIKLIRTAEMSSGIVDTLKQLSDLYYEEFLESQDLLIKLIQPTMIITIGLIITIIIFGTIIPIYESINLIGM